MSKVTSPLTWALLRESTTLFMTSTVAMYKTRPILMTSVTGSLAGLLDAVAHALSVSDRLAMGARMMAINSSSGAVLAMAEWRAPAPGSPDQEPRRVQAASTDSPAGLNSGRIISIAPWYSASEAPSVHKLFSSLANETFKGWWTFPYYSCAVRRWLLSYSVPVLPKERHL